MKYVLPSKKSSSKSGFTLMELMVYVALLGVIVLVAGQVFSDSTKFRIRTEGMIKTSAAATEVASLMLEDVGQTGAKSSKDASGASETFVQKDSLYMDPLNTTVDSRDSSSFRISKSCNECDTDTLTIRRVRYDGDDVFKAVEEVKWFKTGDKLYRSCRTLSNTGSVADDVCPEVTGSQQVAAVEITDHIDSFKVIPAKPRVVSSATENSSKKSYLLPSTDASVKTFRLVPRYGDDNLMAITVTPPSGDVSVSLTGFASNYDYENNEPITDGKKANQVFVASADGATGSWNTLCKKISLEPQIEYEISFSVPYYENASRMFVPGRDHAAVGFRNLSGEKIPGLDDFNFYLPASSFEKPERKVRFTVKNAVTDVCMAFTFASYSPIVPTGKVTLNSVALKKVETSNFVFEENYTPLSFDKKNVKAFLLKVVAKRNGETSSVRQVIQIPSNGPRD